MSTRLGRIPVVFAAAASAGRGDAVVGAEGAALPAATWHGAGCGCCLPRTPGRDALLRLFHARIRGEGAPFERVIVDLPAWATEALRAALVEDAFLAARFIAVPG